MIVIKEKWFYIYKKFLSFKSFIINPIINYIFNYLFISKSNVVKKSFEVFFLFIFSLTTSFFSAFLIRHKWEIIIYFLIAFLSSVTIFKIKLKLDNIEEDKKLEAKNNKIFIFYEEFQKEVEKEKGYFQKNIEYLLYFCFMLITFAMIELTYLIN